MSTPKTNVIRILETAKIPYRMYTYESDGAIDGVTVAQKIGKTAAMVFKTLVTQASGRIFYVFVVPVAAELDLKAAAKAVGEKAVEMIKVADINQITGYVRGGCSPIGMKKEFKTVIDSSCLGLDTFILSAGKIGIQVELDPKDLIKLIHCTTDNIIAN